VLTQEDAAMVNELAWGCVQNMREVATAVGLDDSDLWIACKYKSLSTDLEDNVVLAAAQRAKVDHLVTFDQDLIRKAPVSALLPSDMVALFEM
jgi:predicted nucleic acid-binding protein